jgi:hypothetical protein
MWTSWVTRVKKRPASCRSVACPKRENCLEVSSQLLVFKEFGISASYRDIILLKGSGLM